jgi:hypothetical protein
MRKAAVLLVFVLALASSGAEVESRVLTHYVPQDLLETAVRTEGWTAVPLDLKGGVRKGDTVRIWAGGSIDRGDGNRPGQNAAGPDGAGGKDGTKDSRLALDSDAGKSYALLFKTETAGPARCLAAGRPLEIKLTRDKEQLSVGFNDRKGCYQDNHLGKGLRHELDPLWVRIEVVRTIVD